MMNTHDTLLRIALFACVAGLAAPAQAATGDWVDGNKARIRVVAAGLDADGRLAGAIEIALPDGWKTYWRNPGTAGIAPEFDFSASRNLGRPEVAFPVPHRLDDGYSVTNVYEGSVILPFNAAVPDRTSPADVALTVRLGVCEEVCIPDEATVTLIVPPGEHDAAVSATLAEVSRALPGAAEAGVFAVDSIARTGGTEGKPVFRIVATVPPGADPVAFVEGPEDWAAYAPVLAGRDGNRALYDVKFSRLGSKTPIAGAHVRVTLAAGDRAIDQTIDLD